MIVNKAKLPLERLAEAIAAKGILASDEKLLRTAAEIAPNEPSYWYLLARHVGYFSPAMYGWDEASVPSNPRHRALLERTLRVDPSYLPALYSYAMSKPTHEERMRALEMLATKDPDNAEPYYLMALECFRDITEGRKITEASDREAFEMSQKEWEQVSCYIEEGNACGAFVWRKAEVPSTRDLHVSTHGKLWPARALQNHIRITFNYFGATADSSGCPQEIGGGAVWRQLSRQAKWAAKAADKAGDKTRGLHYLKVMMDCAHKYAGCQPEQTIPLLVGGAIWMISESTAVEIYKRSNDLDAVKKLRAEEAAWKSAFKQCMPLLKKYDIKVKSVKTSRTEYLSYNDYSIEEAGIRKILAGLRP